MRHKSRKYQQTLVPFFLSCQNWTGLSDSFLGKTGCSCSIHHCKACLYCRCRFSWDSLATESGNRQTWCFNKSTESSPFLIPGGFGCKGRFNISSFEQRVSNKEVRRPSSSTFSRLFSICLSSAAFRRASCFFRAASNWAGVWPGGTRLCVEGPAPEEEGAMDEPALLVDTEAAGIWLILLPRWRGGNPRCPGVAQIRSGSIWSRLSDPPYILSVLEGEDSHRASCDGQVGLAYIESE